MNKSFALLAIILQFALTHGTVFKGSLINSSSNSPVASAEVSFRIGTQLPYPSTVSDASGAFVADLEIPDNYLMQILIEANGYCAKRVEVTVSAGTIDVGTVTLDEIKQEQIRLIGTVIDSLSGLPVSGAKIEITKIKGSFTPIMNFYADNAGIFSQNVNITNDYYFVCTVSDSGYYPTSFSVTKAEDSVHKTILLRPEGSIRISVSGQVVDARTGLPVNNARVITGTNFHDVTPDTFFTGSDGIFIRSVAAGLTSSAMPALYCNISADGYSPYTETAPVTGTQAVNFSEIALVSTSPGNIVSVVPQKVKSVSLISPVNTYVSLNGRLISNNNHIRSRNECSAQMVLKVMQNNSSGKKAAERFNVLR